MEEGTRAFGRAIRQLFPGAPKTLVSVEGRPPVEAGILGPGCFFPFTPEVTQLGHSIPCSPLSGPPGLCILFIPTHCLWEAPSTPG